MFISAHYLFQNCPNSFYETFSSIKNNLVLLLATEDFFLHTMARMKENILISLEFSLIPQTMLKKVINISFDTIAKECWI